MNFSKRNISLSFLLGIVLFFVHLFISWPRIFDAVQDQHDAQGGLIWIDLMLMDFPVSLIHVGALKLLPQFDIGLLPRDMRDFNNFLVPAFVYGFLGPLWYFTIPMLISHFFGKIFKKSAKSGKPQKGRG